MPRIEIYEPQGCVGGTCSPEIQEVLKRMERIVQDIRDREIEVIRYNIMEDGPAFLKSQVVKDLIVETEGTDCLPIVVVDGKIMSTENYPTDLELVKWAGFPWEDLEIYANKEKREKTFLFSEGSGGCDSCS
ncbi:MAG: arsenic metallochaperone ArsD family protein [Eubacteriaceae bacterium]